MKENEIVIADSGVFPESIDTTVPHVARVLDYLLGGQANYPADRAVAKQAFAGWPGEVGGVDGVRVDIRGHRAALIRVVRYLAGEVGIRQFLDIGSGLPTVDNVHEVALATAPDSRIVYIDRDPIVVAHARYLLGKDTSDRVAYMEGDLHDPRDLLRRAADTLDFARPVAVVMFGALHFFDNTEAPDKIVRTFVDAVPSGSHIAISHFATDEQDGAMNETFEQMNRQWGESVTRRGHAEVMRFFAGLDLIEPGVVELPDWRPDLGAGGPRPLPMWCGVARKP
ncbi:SAM-dependent methyltransferase [Nocardia terpenica]|nr:SAM-dependent methyltransferase [Nocardia terpenica]